ncbi:MAG: hypothetical protein Q9M31_06650 [Mariprofundus sp.]|nr:hypothetical protein [Mariprofundus sp.]
MVSNAAELFSRSKGSSERKLAAEKDVLYQKVGQLQIEVDWLKKSPGVVVMSTAEKKINNRPR